MKVQTVIAIFLMVSAMPAQASGFCDDVKQLLHTSKTATGATLTLPSPFDLKAKCTSALSTSGARSLHCAWPFSYRSEEATQVFETLVQGLPNCLGPTAQVSNDLGVNHPDFYDLRVFRVEEGEVGVSIKDKGGLQQTYIFLRVQGGA